MSSNRSGTEDLLTTGDCRALTLRGERDIMCEASACQMSSGLEGTNTALRRELSVTFEAETMMKTKYLRCSVESGMKRNFGESLRVAARNRNVDRMHH